MRFSKMHGAGNDFVVIDAIDQPLALTAGQIRQLADRRRGVGFDQLLLLRASTDARAAFAYDIFNTDGSSALQCGNGARCVAAWLVAERALALPAQLLSPAGLIGVRALAAGEIGVELGPPQPPGVAVDARGILQIEVDGQLLRLLAVDMGNPHLVLEVPSVQTAAVQRIGAALNAHPALPRGANVEFVERMPDGQLHVRVFERGVGETLACGSGACAVAVVAIRQGWATPASAVAVHMPGGTLTVSWPQTSAPVLLSGPACRVFDGTLAADFFH